MKTTRRQFAAVLGAAVAALPLEVQAQRPAQKAPPVVSPEVSNDALPAGDIGGGRRAENVKKFEQDLHQDLLPFFESRYRARKEPEQRGIVGLSMGGEQALSVGTRHPELFRWVGGFSSALFAKELEQSYGPFFGNSEAANKNLKLLWVGCGKQDFLIEGNRAFVEALKQRGIRHVFHETEGGHTWTLWRRYLAEFLPLLFRV